MENNIGKEGGDDEEPGQHSHSHEELGVVGGVAVEQHVLLGAAHVLQQRFVVESAGREARTE